MEMGRKPGTGNKKQGAWTSWCHGNSTVEAIPAGAHLLFAGIYPVTLGVSLTFLSSCFLSEKWAMPIVSPELRVHPLACASQSPLSLIERVQVPSLEPTS